jgi:hypothetical protein
MAVAWCHVPANLAPLASKNKNIVTCRVVHATETTGSSLDDWIYWHLGYNLS